MTDPTETLSRGDALLVVDVQTDFCPGGALAIEGGDAVIPVLNRWVSAAEAAGVPVYASRDWHPRGHPSFEAEGGPWPVHCVQDSAGAAFHPDLRLSDAAVTVTKGTRFDKDQYSAFDETGLAEELRRRGVSRVWIGGLAEDVCVGATALDAAQAGFDVHVSSGATRPVTPEGGERTRRDMRAAGIAIEA